MSRLKSKEDYIDKLKSKEDYKDKPKSKEDYIDKINKGTYSNSTRIFYNYIPVLPNQEVIDEEDSKSPSEFPPLKLLEAINGYSTIYAENENTSLINKFDPSALLCLGVLIEEQLKHGVISFDEKYKYATEHFKEIGDKVDKYMEIKNRKKTYKKRKVAEQVPEQVTANK